MPASLCRRASSLGPALALALVVAALLPAHSHAVQVGVTLLHCSDEGRRRQHC